MFYSHYNPYIDVKKEWGRSEKGDRFIQEQKINEFVGLSISQEQKTSQR